MKNIRSRRLPVPQIVVASVLTGSSANLRRFVLLFAALLSISTVHAANITVTNKNDDGTGSLRQAIANSVDGGTIDFSVTPGAITLTSAELLVNKSVTIAGPGANTLAVDGNHARRVFHISSGKTVTISGLTIRNGKASEGGGIWNDHATLTVTNSTLNANHGGQGGGIYNDGSIGGHATLTISNSTLSGNSATDGGAILNEAFDFTSNGGSATLTINNSTLSGNSASGTGGAIFDDGFHGDATLNLHNSTLSGNSAPSGGGIYNLGYAAGATIHIGNTILNQGSSGENIRNVEFGLVQSDGYNLSSDQGVTNVDEGDGAGVGDLNVTGDQKGVDDLKLGPLEDNGGPTFTHELLIGSPAIDKGKDLGGTGKDQRGRTRAIDGDPAVPNTPGDGSDIGAFELVTHKVTNTNNSAAGSLRQAIIDSLDGDAIYFDSSLNGQAITLTSGQLQVDKSVTISGPGANQLAVDGNANGRVFSIVGSGKTVAISGLTIRNGLVENDLGGGIFNNDANLTLTDSVVTLNHASIGGGIYNNGVQFRSASLIISNSTLSGNSATLYGGGIYNDGENAGSATVTIANSTLSGNTVVLAGAGIFNDAHASGGKASLTITNSTLSDNSGQSGGIHNYGQVGTATVTLGNTILNRSAGPTNIVNDFGTVISQGYNLSDDAGVTNSNGGTGGLSDPTDQTNTDPKLGPLANYGGTTFTHALLPGSPAIDKGKDLSGAGKDQRGRTRPFDDPLTGSASGGDNSDIGAFELASKIVTNNQDNGAGSLRQVLADPGLLDGDAIYFDAALNGQAIVLTTGQLVVNKSVALGGPGAANLAVDGNANDRVFYVNVGRTAAISGLTIRNGLGGIYNNHATLIVTNSVVTLNQSANGGGIFNDGEGFGSATLTLNNSTLSGNSATNPGGLGGGIFNDGYSGSATLTITNSTLSGNHADVAGAAIFSDGHTSGSALLTITNCTLTNNSGQSGVIHNFGASGTGTVTLGNTILNGSAGPTNIVNDAGTVTSNGHNLSNDGGVTNQTTGTGALNATGDQINTNPKLGPLANNGGSTLTHALLPGSPALDAGDNTLASNAGLTTDQRGTGFGRVLDAASDADPTQTVDIGAFEADPSVEDIDDKSKAEDTPLSFTFKVGDSASAFTSITATSSNTTLVPNANITVGNDTPSTRTLSITPAANKHGFTAITVTVTKTINGAPVTMSKTFYLTFYAVNDAPTANSQSVLTKEDTAKAITLAAGDVDGDGLTYSVVTVPAHGLLSGTAPNLTYKPGANYHGADSFTFKANDGHANSNTATISITVKDVNDPPVANPQSVAMDENTKKAITLTGSDVEGKSLTFSVVTGPAHGTLTGTAPNLSYKPNANYNGADSFTFKVNDGQLDSTIATVSIRVGMVNEVPIANAQSVTTNENIPKSVTLTGSDADGSVLTFSIVSGPGHGTLTGTPPNLTYTPAVNYSGADSFTFKTIDGSADSNPAKVSVTVVGPASHPLNISTRLNVLTGENVLIGGFYITGSAPKKVIVRAIGPSLNVGGVPIAGRLGDTVLELFDQTTHQKVASNGNWKVDDATGQSQEATITATLVPPPDELESALVVTLNPGPYTAKVSGKDGSTGIALVEAFDLDTAADSKFANISTRGFVAGGDNVMIGGFILGASQGGSEILVRGIGPSLTASGVANPLPDPRVEIHSENGTLIDSNDNWKTDDKTGQSQEAAITATTVPPTNDAESALLVTLPPGNYTAVLGANGAATGVALVEIYNLQ